MPKQKSPMSNMESQGRRIVSNLQRVPKLSKQELQQAFNRTLIEEAVRRTKALKEGKSLWLPDKGIYFNRETKRPYTPHHQDEHDFVFSDIPTNGAVLGSEGSGKSVSGIIKVCERLRRGCSGIMVSPDLPHFRKSLWQEFKRWIPDDVVIPDHQYRLDFSWEPREPFTLAFNNGATLLCGGIEEPMSFEGPNINFYHFDEARRAKTPDAIKVLKGRTRIPTNNVPPAGWITTTKPRSTEHWIYQYYGPLKRNDDGEIEDDYRSFKEDSRVVNLYVKDNLVNLSDGFLEQRAQGLTPEEIALLINNEWTDLDEIESFLPSIASWDACREKLPPLDKRTPIVLALDGAELNDTFGAVAGSWHPTKGRSVTAVRWVRAWQPKGVLLDFDEIERELREFIANFNVVLIVYDAALIRQLMRRLAQVVWTREFSQGRDRLAADKALLDAILQKTIVHDGDPLLRKHLANADKRAYGDDGRKIRMIKRSPSAKIDLGVCTSMMRDACSDPSINLGN